MSKLVLQAGPALLVLGCLLGCGRQKSSEAAASPAAAAVPKGQAPDASPTQEMDPAVKLLVGDTLQSYQRFGYKEVELGTSFDAIHEKTPLKWNPKKDQPHAFWNKQRGGEEFLFDADKKLICYTKSYDGGPDDYLEKLVEVFGKTNKEIKKGEFQGDDGFGRQVSATSRTTVNYTFPKILARIVFVKVATGNSAVKQELTHVIVLDRAWATSLLDKNTKGKRANIAWFKQLAESVKDAEVEVKNLPKLDGTEVRETPDNPQMVTYFDVETEKLNKDRKAGDELRSNVATIERAKDRGRRGKQAVKVHFNFGRYTPNECGRLYRQPARKRTLPSANEGTNALSFTPLSDLVIELNAILLKEFFPPKSDTVEYVRPKRAFTTPYYEWSTADGWKVICGFNDAVTVERLEQKDL